MPVVDALDSSALHLVYAAHTLIPRNETSSNSTSAENAGRPASDKIIGLSLAIASGLFIGCSFVMKKVGLLRANEKYNEEAGEGYGYLKNVFWWGGMTLMIIGEICNFVAYAFTDAILVTPLGALSVVVTTILSAIFLKERLSFIGKVGCFNCIIGTVVIVLNVPEQSAVSDIQQMQKFVIAPGFLSYAVVVIVGSVFIALWAGPRYGKKSMFVYLSVCSLIGGLSVVATQGLGAAVTAQARKGGQFNQWFLYVLLVFVIATLLTEIIYLNKALNLFNAALVTPTYYVFFTSTTIITSAILFRGFKGTAVTITTVIMGFLQICAGVVILQLSKSAKDVPDAAVFKGDLNQVREVAEQANPESEPKADAIRGAASIVRRLSTPRKQLEQQEARRLREDLLSEQLEPLKENEIAEWDGLRRRKTVIAGPGASPMRRKTVHPPLGMTSFPTDGAHEDEENPRRDQTENSGGFLTVVRDRAHTMFHPRQHHYDDSDPARSNSPLQPVALTNINFKSADGYSPALPYGPGSLEEAQERIYGYPVSQKRKPAPSPRSKPLPASPAPTDGSLQPPQEGKRQFSFSNFLRNSRQSEKVPEQTYHRPSTATSHAEKKARQNATEEERLGLVKGDSSRPLMSDTSPEQRKPNAPFQHGTSSSSSQYPYSYGSQRHHRSASPDAISDTASLSDDDPLRVPAGQQHAPFSFSSKAPPLPTSSPEERQPSRRRPSPPAIYTPPTRPSGESRHATRSDTAVPQLPPLPAQQSLRRITIRSASEEEQPSVVPSATRSTPALAPPVQFQPRTGGRSTERDPFHVPASHLGHNDSSTIGMNAAASRQEDESPSRSDRSQPGSRERFAEQSARERAERRERAQKRMSQGPS